MLKIWGRANSMCVQKVLWCCGEADIPFERIDIGGKFGGNDSPEYRALNPNGVIPTIDDDGFVLWESNSIVRYLAARHDAGKLWPTDPVERADAERWMDWQLSTVYPHMPTIFLGLIRTPPDKRDMAAIGAAIERVTDVLAVPETRLAERDFLAGGRLTMADIPLGISIYRFFKMVADRPSFPSIEAWQSRLESRPAFEEFVAGPLH